ncbi:MAG: pilus assembly protein [Planctomycetes bacterium]|nr:pilus assembly protein [Planctomycetota bacterium]MBI3835566.1 pilus assembly protein [Planctomycetota bacterium]
MKGMQMRFLPVEMFRGPKRKRGAAVVEFAVVLPLLLTILFGIIEYGWVFMCRQTLQTAAREGCRIAVLQTETAPYSDVSDRVQSVMAPTGLAYSLSMTHATTANPIESVTVTVPYSKISLMGGFFGPHNYDIGGTCSMRKEGMAGS